MAQSVLSGIYGLLDPVTEELRYIGLSADINSRFINHCKLQTCKKFKATYLHNWLRSLKQKPKLIVIEETKDLKNLEQFYICYFRSLGCRLVNTTDGGEGINGYKFNEKQKEIISKHTKRGMTSEVRNHLSKVKKGKPAKNKILLIDQNGIVYNSLTEAAEKINSCVSSITYHLKNNTNFIKGYKFRRLS